MNIATIDWNEAWRQAQKAASHAGRDRRSFWDKRAPSFADHSKGGGSYITRFLQLMAAEPEWSVLDVGCATGTLAVPLAQQVRSVTALDISPVMIELLSQRCAEAGVTNVMPILGSWEDDWEQLGIGTHDVVIASRSLAIDNLADGIAKLNRAARRKVCISAMVGQGTTDQRINEVVGRTVRKGPDYIYVYNYLHQLGVYADVSIITYSEWRSYESRADALEKLCWTLGELTDEEEQRLNRYLATELVAHDGKWRMPEPRTVRWAYMSWEKENG